MSEEEFRNMLVTYSTEGETMNESIERVVVRGNHAVVIYAPAEGGQSWATLALEDGVWESTQ